jgi:pts system, mannitol-specific iibc component
MIINTNSELSQVVSLLIKTSGYKKTYIADQLGLTRQGLDKLLKKQSFSLDDANKILSVINKKVVAQLENE